MSEFYSPENFTIRHEVLIIRDFFVQLHCIPLTLLFSHQFFFLQILCSDFRGVRRLALGCLYVTFHIWHSHSAIFIVILFNIKSLSDTSYCPWLIENICCVGWKLLRYCSYLQQHVNVASKFCSEKRWTLVLMVLTRLVYMKDDVCLNWGREREKERNSLHSFAWYQFIVVHWLSHEYV